MRVKVEKGHGLGGGRFAEPGEFLELDQGEAERKIAMGYVVAAPELADGPGESEGESDESDKASGKGKRAKR